MRILPRAPLQDPSRRRVPRIPARAGEFRCRQPAAHARESLLPSARRRASPDSAPSSAPEKSSRSRARASRAFRSARIASKFSLALALVSRAAHSAPPLRNCHASPVRRAPCGSRPINASESIVFPEPDSPTIPSVSPSPSVNETSFTGRTQPARRRQFYRQSAHLKACRHALAAPRTVRLSRRGKFDLAAMFATCMVLIGVGLSELPKSNANSKSVLPTLLWSAMLLLFAYIAIITTRHELRNRRIIIEGEATLARVVGQETTGGKNPRSKISYVFKDRAGKFYEGSGYDSRRELFRKCPWWFSMTRPILPTASRSAQIIGTSSLRRPAFLTVRCRPASRLPPGERNIIYRTHPAARHRQLHRQSAHLKACRHGNIIAARVCRGEKLRYHFIWLHRPVLAAMAPPASRAINPIVPIAAGIAKRPSPMSVAPWFFCPSASS